MSQLPPALPRPSRPALEDELSPIDPGVSSSMRTETAIPSNSILVGRPIGEIPRAMAGLTPEKLEEGLALQAEKGGRLGEVLVSIKAVTDEEVVKALSLQLDLPYLSRIFT